MRIQWSIGTRSRRATRQSAARRRLWLESLEERLVLCTDGAIGCAVALFGDPTVLQGGLHGSSQAALDPTNSGPAAGDLGAFSTAAGTTAGTLAAAATGLAIPILNSLPGAPAMLYLNFAGDFVSSWLGYSNISTPAFDTDGNAVSLSQGEVDAITGIWQIVAENYAPFNINVTTVDPRTVSGFKGGVSQIDIGGNGAWTGGSYGGIAQVGGITGSTASNPVRGFVFPANLGNGAVWYTGEAVSHESGHTMGLRHQSAYSGSTKTAEYQQGPGDNTAPIMGNSYYVGRGMWWYGPNATGSTAYQNDLAVIASNSFGLRPRATGGTVSTAAPLSANAGQVEGSGVLQSMTQVDMWSFTTDTGAVSLSVAAPSYGSLHPKIEVLDSAGNVVVNWIDPDASTATWSGTLNTGSYRLVVTSHGVSSLATATNYGFDIGTYSITGSLVTPVNYLAAPSNLTATAVGTSQINLAWTNGTASATDILVEQSTDNGATFTQIADLSASTTTYAITSGLVQGTTYTFRVRACNATATLYSDYSNQASVPMSQSLPAAPSNFTAMTVSTGGIRLAWVDNANNETGFAIERAAYNPKGRLGGWSQIATVRANLTSYDDTGVTGGSSYAYRIRSYNSAGYSAYVTSNPYKVAGGTTSVRTKGNGPAKSEATIVPGLLVNVPAGPLSVASAVGLGASHRLSAPATFEAGTVTSNLVLEFLRRHRFSGSTLRNLF